MAVLSTAGAALERVLNEQREPCPDCGHAGVPGLCEVTVETTDSCACVPGDCWK